MDLKNVIFAIALSFAVLFGWSVIFETPQIEEQKKLEQSKSSTNAESDNSDVPSVNVEKEKVLNISRDDAIKSSKRINFENENVKGSISLKGLLIDDIIFKKYNKDVDSDEKVKYLNPSETNDGYFIESLELHGPLKGTYLGLRRITKCHPVKTLGGNSGIDLVPKKKKN